MTREETTKLIKIIQASFPQWEVANKTELVDVWTMVCADDDFNAMQFGLKNYIQNDTTGFAPSIGQIRNSVKQVAQDGDDTEELIGLLRKAIKNGNYGYTEEYALLPPTLQKAIGCAENIRAWASQPKDQFESVTLSAVRRAIRATKQHEENVRTALPIKQDMIEKSKTNVLQLETQNVANAVPLPENIPTETKETKTAFTVDVSDEVKESIMDVWNRKGRQPIYSFHFKAPSIRDKTLEVIGEIGFEQLLRGLDVATNERYLSALKEIQNVNT